MFLNIAVYVDLISKQRELNANLPDIHIACTAGAICTPNLVKDIQKHLNVMNVRSIYGLTETTAAVFQSLPSDSNETLQDSVGFISDHTEVKVIDGSGNPVPFGQPGELCVRGYMTLLDYYDDTEKTTEVLGADGWFKTGDQFVLHENGYANIVGRLKDMIIRGGENIYPREIEDFLNTHPDVKETHVIGKMRALKLQLKYSSNKPHRNSRRTLWRRGWSFHSCQRWKTAFNTECHSRILSRTFGAL